MAHPGRVLRIWSKRSHHGVMDPREAVTLEAGGILGDANFGRDRRQVTLIRAESWREAEAELGAALDPVLRRANLLLAGIDLEESRGRILEVGACRLRIRGETRPCYRMEEAHPGLLEALKPHWRGGAFAEVLMGGPLRVGDPATWQDEPQGDP